ncbi:hypothetical protein EDB85DRAFT_1945729 [Lactarius pseudohatsudake]|nr:hypothetical protein EDB85DRAFT_1945729 [Lactarius pseudohatsudake]
MFPIIHLLRRVFPPPPYTMRLTEIRGPSPSLHPLSTRRRTINPTAALPPFAQGSASELFKCVVKKPEVIQTRCKATLSMSLLSPLPSYASTPVWHRIETSPSSWGVLMALAWPSNFWREGHFTTTLSSTRLHAYGLSHGDLSLLNVQVLERRGELMLKLIDFGRSVSADSSYAPPDGDAVDPWGYLNPERNEPRVEQIFPGTRPFSAPEILRGECQDAQLADAYSFGMVLVCLERGQLVDVKPWNQRKDVHPADLLEGCKLFEEKIRQYLRRWNERRRLSREDMMDDVTD